nr:methanogen output domain 1-containing protein [Candidatus Njordarchaeota archaeon]
MRLESREAVERYNFLKGVVEFIALNPNTTIPEIVRSTDCSYTAVKHAVDELVEQGVLKCERRVTGKRGRPAEHFTLEKPFIIISPPRQYLFLTKMIMQGLVGDMGVERVKNFFSELGRKMGVEVAKNIVAQTRKISLDECAQSIENLFNEYGSHCKVSLSRNNMIVNIHNCIFYEISKEYEGIICASHNALFKSLFNSLDITLLNFSHAKCMAKGDKCCVFKLQVSK